METAPGDSGLGRGGADDAALDDLLAVALDRGRGRTRGPAVLALGEIDDPRSVEALAELLADPQVAAEAATALELLGSRAAPDDHTSL